MENCELSTQTTKKKLTSDYFCFLSDCEENVQETASKESGEQERVIVEIAARFL